MSATQSQRIFSHQRVEDVPPEVWFDRDLSWLEFNRRVLHEALDERTPLLERIKFLAIFASNLDEFFMKRVGAMRTRAFAGGLSDIDAFNRHMLMLRTALLPMLETQASAFDELRTQLAERGICLARWDQLSERQQQEASDYFDRNVSPALTPLRMDPLNPFPFLSNLSVSWGFMLLDESTGEQTTARVKIPPVLRQWVPIREGVAASQLCYIFLGDLIRHFAPRVFPGLVIQGAMCFRVSRNAEIEVEEDEDHLLTELIREQLRQRRFQPVVRLEFGKPDVPELRRALVQQLELGACDIYESAGLPDYTGLMEIAGIDRSDLRDPPWLPLVPKAMDNDTSLFAAIRHNDLLVHHPYESFDATVERFIRDAANDALTTNIKMTVYRLGDDTPFVRSLIKAAESGKQVACLVELKARFDEERNLHWASELRKAGDHVIYGVRGLKTHTKLALVVRRESNGLQCYAHIGTGNYHVKTARLYTDFGLFTADEVITNDVVNLFHYLTGYARTPRFEKLLVAPLNMRQRFTELIQREILHQQSGRSGRIIAKMNQLEDVGMIRALIDASRAGVRIELIVRGLCCLKPGVAGFTENVAVRSIVGRFLEHGRVFYFGNGKTDPLEGEFYMGSADWMERNLNRRVEAIVPVEDVHARQRLWENLSIELEDRRNAWRMHADGSYSQHEIAEGEATPLGTHATLMQRTRIRHDA